MPGLLQRLFCPTEFFGEGVAPAVSEEDWRLKATGDLGGIKQCAAPFEMAQPARKCAPEKAG